MLNVVAEAAPAEFQSPTFREREGIAIGPSFVPHFAANDVKQRTVYVGDCVAEAHRLKHLARLIGWTEVLILFAVPWQASGGVLIVKEKTVLDVFYNLVQWRSRATLFLTEGAPRIIIGVLAYYATQMLILETCRAYVPGHLTGSSSTGTDPDHREYLTPQPAEKRPWGRQPGALEGNVGPRAPSR